MVCPSGIEEEMTEENACKERVKRRAIRVKGYQESYQEMLNKVK